MANGQENNYISLQDAVKLCSYSQEYLSLRARQGKLKALKLGRNWVTTEEWLQNYLGNVQEYNGKINKNKKEILEIAPPENLPVAKLVRAGLADKVNFNGLRPAFVMALAFCLLVGGGVLGKESFVKSYAAISQNFEPYLSPVQDFVAEKGERVLANFSGGVKIVSETIGNQQVFVGETSVTLQEAGGGTLGVLGDYLQWVSDRTSAFWQKAQEIPIARTYVSANDFLEERISRDIENIKKGYSSANEFVEEKVAAFGDGVSQGYFSVNDSLEEKLAGGAENLKQSYLAANRAVERKISQSYEAVKGTFQKAYQFVKNPWRWLIPEKEILVGKEEIEELKAEFEKFKENPVVVERVEVSKVVEPVKEITREVEKVTQVTKVDEAALAEVRNYMSYLEGEIGKRLYAPGGVISQTIYVTEPVSSPKIYQENGEIVLQTLGSGNVILSAATGLQLHGQQVVIKSTSLLNPWIYLASNTKIDGTLTAGNTSVGTLSAGATDIGGALTVTGDTTITGDITVVGNQSYSGAIAITAASASPALSVTQTGSGETLKLAYDSSNYLGITASSTGDILLDASGSSAGFIFQDAIYQPIYGSDDGLVLYLPFSEGMTSSSASTAYDRSPYGHDGTLTGFPMPEQNATSGSGWSTTTCKAGSCLSFDGADDYVNLGNLNTQGTFDAGKNWTISLWFKVDSYDNQGAVFANNYGDTEVIKMYTIAGGSWDGWFLVATRDSTNNSFYCYLLSDTNTGWHYIAVTREYGGNQVCYLDGKAHTTQTDDRAGDFQAEALGTDWYLGRVRYSSDYNQFKYFDGSVDEVMVYNRALSADEVRTHYLRGTQAAGTVLADSFRVVNTTNNITFQVDGSGNTTFNQALATTTFLGNIAMSDDKWLGLGEDKGRIVFDDQSTDYLTILDANVGISTTTPRYTLDVWGDLAVGTSTDTNTPILFVDSGDGGQVGIGTTTLTGLLTVGTSTPALVVAPNGYIGIGTSTPEEALHVVGNALISGDIVTIAGDIMPYTPRTQNIGSAAYDWYNIYAYNVIANNIDAGSSTIAGTSAEIFTINSDATSDASSTLRFYRGTDTPHALITWDPDYHRFDFSFPLYLSETGSLTAASSLTLSSGGSSDIVLSSANNIGVATTSPRYLLDVWGDLAVGTSTDTNTPILFVDSGDGGQVGIGTTTLAGLLTVGTSTPSLVVAPNGYVGIATSTPSAQLAVAGNIMGSGNLVLYGQTTSTIGWGLIPESDANENYSLGSSAYRWSNIYAATGTFGGTVTIDTDDIAASGALTISSGASGNIILSPAGVVTISNGLISQASSTIIGNFTVEGDATTTGNFAAGSNLYVYSGGNVGIASTTPGEAFSVQGNILGSGNIVISGTINTGQGATELYLMNQDVQTTDNVTFATLNTGQGAYELYAMDQDVLTTDNVLFANLTLTYGLTTATTTFSSGFLSQASSTITGVFNIDSAGTNVTSTDDINFAFTNQFRIATSTDSDILTIDDNGGVYLANSMYQDIYGSDDGLVLYLPFSEGMTSSSANIAYDRSPYGNDGTATNMPMPENNATSGESGWATTTAKCKVPGCMSFDGTDDYVGVAHDASQLLTTGGSIEAWIKSDTVGETAGRIIDKSTGTTGNNGYYISVTGANKVGVQINGGAAVITDTIVFGNWYHVVVTWDNTGYVTLYLNGAQSGTPGISADPAGITTTNALTIGNRSGATDRTFDGSLDEVRIYNRALSADEIRAHYLRGTGAGGAVLADKFRVIGTDNNINFQINDSGSSYLNTGYNFGLGTTNPAELLTVTGGGISTNYGISAATGTFTGLLTQTGGFISSASSTIIGNFRVEGDATTTGNFAVGNVLFVQQDGNVGIGTTTPDNIFVVNSQTANALTVTAEGNLAIGMATSSTRLTMASGGRRGDITIGDFNAEIIDDMEVITDWSSWTAANITAAAETSIVKVGAGSLKITTAGTAEDKTAAKTYSSSQDWSAYERLGFWIYSDLIATSTATTTQLITVGIADDGNDSASSTHKIYIQQEDRWQYEEWNISGVQHATSVDHIFFKMDFSDLAVNFYVDQIRLYDDTERTGEIFVDADGSLVIFGRDSVEIGRADGSGNKPGIKVDTAIVELNQPLSVNVGGDVGFDYDIQFLSTGLSQITSEGPLRIAGGDSNHAENLTLTTGGTGDVIVELANASSSFMIMQGAFTTTTAFIINSEMSATTSVSNSGKLFEIISDYGSDENSVFVIDAGGSFYYDMTGSTPASDVAENYYVADQTIGAGDVVCLNGSPLTVEKCSETHQDGLIGVISSRPALLMGSGMESSRMVALTGRVPVKISDEGGAIAIGDALTSASSTPGRAMKATGPGKILGYALEPFGLTSDVNATTSEVDASGIILAFINLAERNGGDLTVQQNGAGTIEVQAFINNVLTAIFSIDEEGAMVVGKLKTQELCVGGVCVTEADFLRVFGQTTTTSEVSSSTSEVTETVYQNGDNRPCGSDMGVCQIGVQIYQDGVWGECMGSVEPAEELCDGVDNDCDGEIDEGNVCSSAPAPEPEPEPDTTPPVITLLGEAIVDVGQGAEYVDAGATSMDDVDGDITANIITDNPVDTAATSTYTVSYNVADAAGNAAATVTRTVNVTAN